MITPDGVRTLARYNAWMNGRLYAACAGLDDAERKRDAGAFFKSIHGTLNHLLVGDRVWLGRFTGVPFVVDALDRELFAGFAALRMARVELDVRIERWAATVTAAKLEETLFYLGILKPLPRAVPMGLAVSHFFNHQAHHRGQVTTLLSQRGIDVGVTDLVALPEEERHAAPSA